MEIKQLPPKMSSALATHVRYTVVDHDEQGRPIISGLEMGKMVGGQFVSAWKIGPGDLEAVAAALKQVRGA